MSLPLNEENQAQSFTRVEKQGTRILEMSRKGILLLNIGIPTLD